MKNTIRLLILAMAAIISSGANGALADADAEFLEKQNAAIVQHLLDYFDSGKGFDDDGRHTAFLLADSIVHGPAPLDKSVKHLFGTQYKRACDGIAASKPAEGVRVWNLYNMTYVVQSPQLTVAFDLIRLPECLQQDGQKQLYDDLAERLADECDVLFLSHFHGDHTDAYVTDLFIKNGKTVIAPKNAFVNEKFYKQIVHPERDGKAHTVKLGDKTANLLVYPGHQADTENNFYFLTLPNGITVAHSGDQSQAEDFAWIDKVSEEVQTDVLMVNYWTIDPLRVARGIRPKLLLPGHINEMQHMIRQRGPFWKSTAAWKDAEAKVLHLFWGESCDYKKGN